MTICDKCKKKSELNHHYTSIEICDDNGEMFAKEFDDLCDVCWESLKELLRSW